MKEYYAITVLQKVVSLKDQFNIDDNLTIMKLKSKIYLRPSLQKNGIAFNIYICNSIYIYIHI